MPELVLSRMRTLATVWVVSLVFIGCASPRTHQDSFISLHALVKQTLADSRECGPVITNEIVGGRYFEVKPQPRGLQITVSERQFLEQKEWERRYASGTNQMSQFMKVVGTNHPINAETATRWAGITNFFGLSGLPEWSYQRIGVDVSVQEVDEVYPGLKEDDAEAQKRYGVIITLLKPYQRANGNR